VESETRILARTCACFVFHLDAVFSLSAIPEISDADVEAQAAEVQAGEEALSWKQYRLFHTSFA
jgi:MFS transporter, FHS family, L-fucose permease